MTIKIGAQVYINGATRKFYGTVIAVEHGQCLVQFTDGSRHWYSASAIHKA